MRVVMGAGGASVVCSQCTKGRLHVPQLDFLFSPTCSFDCEIDRQGRGNLIFYLMLLEHILIILGGLLHDLEASVRKPGLPDSWPGTKGTLPQRDQVSKGRDGGREITNRVVGRASCLGGKH